MNFHIDPAAQRTLAALGVEALYLFGSQAKGQAGRTSDFDIGIVAKRSLSLAGRATIEQCLARATSQPGAQIDLVEFRSAPPLLAFHMVRDGKLLFGTPAVADRTFRRAVTRYIDARRIRRETEDYVRSHAG